MPFVLRYISCVGIFLFLIGTVIAPLVVIIYYVISCKSENGAKAFIEIVIAAIVIGTSILFISINRKPEANSAFVTPEPSVSLNYVEEKNVYEEYEKVDFVSYSDSE